MLYKNLMGMNSEEIIWILLKKKEYIPIDIIYEPTLDENKEIEWFFAPDISLSYVGYIEKIRNNEKYMEIRITRQCHYCSNFFVKTEEKMKKHLQCCSGKAGFTFFFDNGRLPRSLQ